MASIFQSAIQSLMILSSADIPLVATGIAKLACFAPHTTDQMWDGLIKTDA
jgi:hypothetical protein